MDASGTDSAGHEKTALPVIADLGWAGLGYAQLDLCLVSQKLLNTKNKT